MFCVLIAIERKNTLGDKMSHSTSWIDDEVVGVSWCGMRRIEPALVVGIYEWVECPLCHKQLKLRQTVEILEQEQGSEPNG